MDQPSIFVSYAWEAENERKVVDSLEKAFLANGIQLHRDVHLEFKDSIKAFMDALARGDCIVVVLSKPYLESENCMEELLKIHENGRFRKRVFPIVLQGTKIHKARDRIPYIRYWERMVSDLKSQMETIDPTYIQGIRESLDLYADIRRSIPKLMDILGDLNSLTEAFHVDTKFEALLEKIKEEYPGLKRDKTAKDVAEKFRRKIHTILSEEIERPVCRDLKLDLASRCGNPDVVQALENSCKQTKGGLEQAIEWLHLASESTLRSMQDANVSEQERTRVWEAAKTILGWFVLLSVDEHWFDENKKYFQAGERNIRVEIPARTHTAIEIVLSRNNERSAVFTSNESGSKVSGSQSLDNAIPEPGWNINTSWDQIKLTIWNYLYRETRSSFLNAQESEKLRSLIRTRTRRKGDYYFTIHSSDHQSPLNNDEVQKYLASELPELKVIAIKLQNEESVLVVSEVDLEVLISEFLNISKTWS